MDIVQIIKVIWIKRIIILRSCSLFLLIGIVYAQLSPVKYISETTFIPQVSEKSISNNAGIGTLASLAGINIDQVGQSNDLYISPYLYPKIAQSEEFLIKIINEELVLLDGKKIRLKEYLKNENSAFFISKYFNKKNYENRKKQKFLNKYNFISKEDYSTIANLKQKFSIELNERVGYMRNVYLF